MAEQQDLVEEERRRPALARIEMIIEYLLRHLEGVHGPALPWDPWQEGPQVDEGRVPHVRLMGDAA